MGNILPASITNPQLTGPNALPNRALFNNGNINYGAAIGDIGDILRGLGGPAGSWDPILQRRAQEDAAQQQHAVEAQRYQDQLKQQQFANDLALKEYQLKVASAVNKAQMDPDSPANFLGTGRPNTIINSIQPSTQGSEPDIPIPSPKPNNLGDSISSIMGPAIANLSQLQGTSAQGLRVTPANNQPEPLPFDANRANNIAMRTPLQISPNGQYSNSSLKPLNTITSALTLAASAPNIMSALAAVNPVGSATAAPLNRRNVNTSNEVPDNVTNQDMRAITNGPGSVAVNNGTANTPRLGDPNNIPTNEFITPDTLQGNARELYDRFYMHQPALAQDLIRAANHQIPLSDILRNWKNPADRTAITQSLYTINPNYNPQVAQKVQQFEKDIGNQKSPTNVNFRSDQELSNLITQQIENAQKLPSLGLPLLTKGLDKVEGAFGSQILANYYQLADAIYKEVERGRLQGRPTVSSLTTLAPLYDPSLGPDILTKSYKTLLDGVDRRIYSQIYNSANATQGYGGYKSYHLDPIVLKRLHDKGYINITNDGVIKPLVNPDDLNK